MSIDPASGGLGLVPCALSSLCVAVDGYGNATFYNGTKWSTPKAIDPDARGEGLTSLSCTSSNFCAGDDWTGNAIVYNGTAGPIPNGLIRLGGPRPDPWCMTTTTSIS
jgi:hypothetical protein